jgi:penicillin-binding protein 1A
MTALQKAVGYQWSKSSPALHSQYLSGYDSLKAGTDYEPFEHFWDSNPEVVNDWIRSTDRFEAAVEQGTDEGAALAQLKENTAFLDSLKAIKTRLETGVVSIDPRTGHVKAWVGGRDFRTDKYDKVSIAERQPGSTFKPFTYTAAIDNGYSPYATFLDSTFTWRDPATDSTWSPNNFAGSSGQMLTLSQGLARSKNTITARVALEINPSTVAQYAREMGIRGSRLQEVPSIALGTSNVTLLEMASAYATLANGGLYQKPVAITRVEDRYGNMLWEASPRPQEALSEQTAYTVVDMMRGVIDYGTGVRIRSSYNLGDYDLAGKTGTTQKGADTWFMLMHPNLVTGSWVGFNDQRLTFRTNWWGQGAHSALLVVGDYYRRIAQKDSLTLSKDAAFPMVDSYGPPEAGADTVRTQGDRVGW